MRQLILLLSPLLLAAPAHAVDGVLEINQTCAVNTGCFAGDTSGFPVTIDGNLVSSLSFRLTSNLQVPDQNTTAILVSAFGASLDLNGFAIRGTTTCSGNPNSCAPISASQLTGIGIDAQASGVEVRNGSVFGMGGTGVLSSSEEIRIENVRALQNGRVGIQAGGSALISNCTANRNGSIGIAGGVVIGSVALRNTDSGIFGVTLFNNRSSGNGKSGLVGNGRAVISGNTALSNGDSPTHYGVDCGSMNCVITDNLVSINSGAGIRCGTGCTIEGNSVRENGLSGGGGILAGIGSMVINNAVSGNGISAVNHGIQVGASSTIAQNTVSDNDGDGISCTTGCTVAGNTVDSNGVGAAGDGIEVDSGSQVYGNTVRNHEGLGLRGLNLAFGYRDNIFTENNGGNANAQVNSAGADLGGNICGNPIACP